MRAILYLLIISLMPHAVPAKDDPNAHAADSSSRTRWIWNGNKFDAGKVKQFDEVRHEFVFRNPLEIPVMISSGAPSCACFDSANN